MGLDFASQANNTNPSVIGRRLPGFGLPLKQSGESDATIIAARETGEANLSNGPFGSRLVVGVRGFIGRIAGGVFPVSRTCFRGMGVAAEGARLRHAVTRHFHAQHVVFVGTLVLRAARWLDQLFEASSHAPLGAPAGTSVGGRDFVSEPSFFQWRKRLEPTMRKSSNSATDSSSSAKRAKARSRLDTDAVDAMRTARPPSRGDERV